MNRLDTRENEQDDWHNCYNDNWQGVITPESFAHPAKFAHGLIRRIYQHAIDEGWLKPGDTVADPFAGVGLGALYAQMAGLNYVGVELEPRFVEMGRANLALWEKRYAGKLPKWGTAKIYQGDSRRLSEVLGQVGAVVSSPPFMYTPGGCNSPNLERDMKGVMDRHKGTRNDGYGQTPGQLGSMPPGDVQAVISSPPYASGEKGHPSLGSVNKDDWGQDGRDIAGRRGVNGSYGDTPGNIANLPSGDVQAVISSPPYAESMNQSAGANDTDARIERMRQAGIDVDNRANVGGANGVARQAQAYGNTPGQLGAMKAVISSPPFENSIGTKDEAFWKEHNDRQRNWNGATRAIADYGETFGQIGASQGETFWSAARQIVEQCHKILVPNGYAIWVTKRYVKNGQIVDFTAQWIALCEACGFELIHHHRAMLVKDNGTQEAMAQGEETGAVFTNLLGEVSIEAGAKLRNRKHSVARKSFFRNLYEIKKKAATHWETLERDDKAALLWASHAELWENYHQRLSEDKEPQKPSDKKIISSAQVAAWVRDGQIDYKIETSVDWEDVLCLRKIENSLERIA